MHWLTTAPLTQAVVPEALHAPTPHWTGAGVKSSSTSAVAVVVEAVAGLGARAARSASQATRAGLCTPSCPPRTTPELARAAGRAAAGVAVVDHAVAVVVERRRRLSAAGSRLRCRRPHRLEQAVDAGRADARPAGAARRAAARVAVVDPPSQSLSRPSQISALRLHVLVAGERAAGHAVVPGRADARLAGAAGRAAARVAVVDRAVAVVVEAVADLGLRLAVVAGVAHAIAVRILLAGIRCVRAVVHFIRETVMIPIRYEYRNDRLCHIHQHDARARASASPTPARKARCRFWYRRQRDLCVGMRSRRHRWYRS